MNLLTIAGIAAGAWLAWSYFGRDMISGMSTPGPQLATDDLERDAAVCLCCDLAEYFSREGDAEGQRLTADLAKRILAPEGQTDGAEQ